MNLEKYIPFEEKKFRPHQREAIETTIAAIETGVETILINAPVGFGKSIVGYCIAKYFEEKGDWSYIYTKTTFLQDQYLRDFKDLKTAMGRGNFECLMTPGETCSYGKCKTINKFSCPVGVMMGSDIELKSFDHPFTRNCLYWQQKYDAINNPISILNYPYMITDNMYLNHFKERKLGIYDEGHGLESSLMNAFELQISDYQIFYDLNTELEVKGSIEEWADELHKFGAMYGNLAKETEEVHQRERFESREEALNSCADFLEEDSQNWIFNVNIKKDNDREITVVTFKPIEIQEYTDVLFSKTQHKVIMSGSILKPDIFINELGLSSDNFEYIEVPSIVPPKQRPIIRDYVGSMSRRNIDTTMPLLIKKIQEIADNHLEEKGIIHTFTYGVNYKLFEKLRHDDRFIFHTQKNRVEKTNEFKESPDDEGLILVSPYSYEGVDFPYDQARWQIICKNPYPYLGDAQVKARIQMDKISFSTDWGWLNRQIALVLSQMYGRTNRAVDDYSVTYILDKDIERALGPASLVTDYFLEGLEGYNYTTKLIIVDPSKMRSRGVNRENQEAILGNIRDDGLDTLEKLRQAYKRLPGGSYIEVKKAVDYLLKCGAIKYAEE